ncbi:MAG: cadherin-like beta sandwich domain-containing protein [Lachnospiraceae bacterium]|nr:cadherin-like beta sandwich domain-containing protein [Lachnospiraceae bacterium]
MKKLMKNVGIVLLAFLMCVLSIQEPAYAAGASVTIAVSNSNLKIGDTISVTVNVSTEGAIGSYSMAVTYDSSVLEYTGGSGNGGGGTVMIAGYGDGSQSRLSATLNFKAVGNGSTAISTSGGEAYAWDESVLPISHAGATVTVSAPQAPSGGGGNGGNNGNNGGNGEAPLTGSDDNYLKSLEISPGTLNPAFQSGTTSYTVELPEDTTSIVVSAVPRDSKAKVAVSHNNDLEPGANKTYIVVTAENGTQRTYVLNINCGEVEDEKELPPVTIDGAEYTFATAEQMEGVTVPEGFQTAEETYDEQSITVYNSPNQLIQIVYLLNPEGNGQWFIYNKENSSFVPYIEFQANVNRYLILTADASVAIPAGYEATEIEIQGQKVTGYIKDGNDEFVLVYAMNIQGETGFYLYDTKEGTYQRYVEPEMIEEPASTEEPSTESVIVTEDEKVQNLQVILYVLSGVSVILLGGIIGIVIYFKKKA